MPRSCCFCLFNFESHWWNLRSPYSSKWCQGQVVKECELWNSKIQAWNGWVVACFWLGKLVKRSSRSYFEIIWMDHVLSKVNQSTGCWFYKQYGWSYGILGWEKLGNQRWYWSWCLYIFSRRSSWLDALLDMGLVWRNQNRQGFSCWLWERTSKCKYSNKFWRG